ncbi:hypothetical protein PAPYR_541 [Paratrimastix pyriformis]|uniref:Uncharacterized protein n=1 Tax=Paratrimastix pyriformis TaxID=342808 RepID=A0ABQ8UTW2_9EUKA|nr:hypothetical protein PAPYR_541 [Paratrimastix pyriformis]
MIMGNGAAAATWARGEDSEVDAGTPVAIQPRSLTVDGLDAVSLLGLLSRHGARLRDFSLWGFRAVRNEAWTQLMQALSGLPRLTSLMLNISGANSSTLSLACPQLRNILLRELPDEAKVVLACPLLEQLRGIKDRSRQLMLVLPAPNLQ